MRWCGDWAQCRPRVAFVEAVNCKWSMALPLAASRSFSCHCHSLPYVCVLFLCILVQALWVPRCLWVPAWPLPTRLEPSARGPSECRPRIAMWRVCVHEGSIMWLLCDILRPLSPLSPIPSIARDMNICVALYGDGAANQGQVCTHTSYYAAPTCIPCALSCILPRCRRVPFCGWPCKCW